jgi:4-oxalocrotonate tautomerase
MPHIVVNMMAGRPDDVKTRLASRITESVMEVLDLPADAISVGIVDVASGDWMTEVYDKEIVPRQDILFKRPGYGPLAADGDRAVSNKD